MSERQAREVGPAGRDRLRVLLVMGTTGGGVGRHVRSLAASLTEAGHRVIVAAPPEAGRDLDLAGSGARFVPVRIHDRPHPVRDVRAVRSLARLARQTDVVHAHGLRAGGLAALALWGGRGRRVPDPVAPAGGIPGARRARGTPLAVTVHNAPPVRTGRWGAVALVYGVLERLVARRADVVLGVSGDLEERMSRLGARDVRHAVVPAPAGRATRTPEQVRAELAVVDRPLVLCVARLADQKGLPLLLDAAARLRRPDGPLVLVAGDGPLRDAIQSRIDAERLPVRLLGWRQDVPDLLAAADVVVSTAVWEGQPIAIQQALRAGAAIVATDVGGTAEVTADAAVLVRYGDAPGLAHEIDRLLTDDRARTDLSRRARMRAAELPGDDDARDAAASLYRALVHAVSPT